MALALDGSTPAYAADSADPWVTASFTPPNSALLVAVCTGDWFGGTPTFTFTDSQGVFNTARWVSAGRFGSLNNGVVEIFTAQMSSSEGGVSRTIQCDSSLAAGPGGVKVLVFTGATLIGPVDVSTGATGGFTDPVNVNVTTTRADTWVVGGAVDWDGDGNFTSTDTVESFSVGGSLDSAFFRKGSARATPGTETVNINPAGAASAGCYGFVGITSTDAAASFLSQGAAVAGTTSITTAAYGAGWAAGDLAVCCVASNHSTTEATEPTVAGFTKIGTLNGGGGAQGTGTGNRRLTYFTRECQAGDDTTPTVSLTGGNVMIAAISIFRAASGRVWDSSVAAFGAETTAGTSWSQVMTSDPGFDADDMVVAACAVRDTCTSTAEGFSATGATFNALASRSVLSSETGNDIALHVWTTTVLTGPSSAAGTRTSTHGTSETGVAGVLRIRTMESGPNEGTASGAVGWAGTVTGKKFPAGTVTGAVGWGGVVNGKEGPGKGTVTGAVGWGGTVNGAQPKRGTVTGAVTWGAGVVTGKRVPKGTSSGAVGWAGTVTGTKPLRGTASGAVGWGGTVTGARRSAGTASGAVGWSGTVNGKEGPGKGTVTGAVGWGGVVRGFGPGTVAGSITWAGTVTGKRFPKGAVTGAVGWAGTVTGTKPLRGSATGAVGWGGVVTGARQSTGTASGAVGWSGAVVTGKEPSKGTATGAVVWGAGSADGSAPIVGANEGSAEGTVAWAGTVTGKTALSGSAAGAVGWAGTVTGARVGKGTATGAVGWGGLVRGFRPGTVFGSITWAGTVTGSRTAKGTAAGAVGWGGTVTGKEPAKGTATGAVSWAGTAVGNNTGGGAAVGGITWGGTVTGITSRSGSATAGPILWAGTVSGGAGPNEGAASGAVGWGGAVTGKRVPKGTGTGAVGWVGTVGGTEGSGKGSAVGGVIWVGVATGKRFPKGAVLGGVIWGGSATGGQQHSGSAAGAVGWGPGAVTGVKALLVIHTGPTITDEATALSATAPPCTVHHAHEENSTRVASGTATGPTSSTTILTTHTEGP